MKGTKGTTDGSTLIGALNGSGVSTALNVDGSGNLKVVTSGGGSAVSISDGSDVCEGTTTDAAVTSDTSGTLSAKLRGLIKIFADVWDSTNHLLNIGEKAVTSGGTTPFHALSVVSNNATIVKASAGQIYGICISNASASVRWFKLYDKAIAPAPATDTVKRAIQIPANSTVICVFPKGLSFSTGIAFAAVANISDTDNTSISANDLSMDLDYK